MLGCRSAEFDLGQHREVFKPDPVFPPLADREAVAHVLPKVSPVEYQIQMSDGVEVIKVGWNRLRKVTVEEKLASLGAKVVAGKVVDRNGKEIFFWRQPDYGTDPGAEYLRRVQEQSDRMKREGTVIFIDYWPGREKGTPAPPRPC